MDLPKRKPNRLPNHDYGAPGAYFVTICTQNHRCLLSSIVVVGEGFPRPFPGFPRPRLSEYGKIVETLILSIPEHYPAVTVDKYVVMPNHVHLILRIGDAGGETPPLHDVPEIARCRRRRGGVSPPVSRVSPPVPPTLGNIIGWFKYQATKQINLLNGSPGAKIFQRSFHDHVIHGQADYDAIWNYIDNNPAKWAEDKYYTP